MNCNNSQQRQQIDLIKNKIINQLPTDKSDSNVDKLFDRAFEALECVKDDEIRDIGKLWPKTFLKKDFEEALAKKQAGNEHFQAGRYEQALHQYNTAVRISPCPQDFDVDSDAEEFSLILANRAAVLAKFRQHKLAVQDLQLAFRMGYPKRLHHKAFQRLVASHIVLRDTEAAVEAYNGLVKSLPASDLAATKQKKLADDTKNTLLNYKQQAARQDRPAAKPMLDQLYPADRHTEVNCFSSKVKLEHSELQGRYCVAKEDIQVGEVVVREEAFIMFPYAGKLYIECAHCLRQTAGPLPCHACLSAVFCSPACRRANMAAHRWECRLSLSNLGQDTSAEEDGILTQLMTVVRSVLQMPVEFFLDNAKLLTLSRPDSDDAAVRNYQRYFNLVKHFGVLDLAEHLAVSLFLLLLLEFTGYFGDRNGLEDRRTMGRLLCHYYAAVQCNNHATFMLTSDGDNLMKKEMSGLGLFVNVASYINHSCDPNTFVVDTDTREQVTVASRTIYKGEEICHIYQGHYGDTERAARRSSLMNKFHFDCQCLACQADFPQTEVCLQQGKTFAEASGGQLRVPASLEELKEADLKNDEMRKRSEAASEAGQVRAAYSVYVERVRLVSHYLKSPHVLHLIGRPALIDCLWYLTANKALAFKPHKLPVYF